MERILGWIIVAVAAVTMVWSSPLAAEERGDLPTVATTLSGGTATAPKLPASMKKKAKKRKTPKKKNVKKKSSRKKAKKKSAPSKAKKHALGLKGAMSPFNDMNVTRAGAVAGDVRQVDYDFGIIWGWGAQYQYRVAENFYLSGEFLYWYPEVSDTSNHPDPKANFRESDALINLGVGLRFNVMGGEDTTDRVYLKGHVGFTDYAPDDANTDSENRVGFYFNAGAGVEHMFSRTFTVFADGGYFYNSFTSPGDDEEDGTLQGVILNGGFLFHWEP
jgi:hypothetical protein